ncbi:TlyA family RNA methyltransferase [Bittarella massiliensis (ex Durand et al. 2017)]|uniref:TlyA family RNA methyltransferase n=1 Tax=Bittarella massiliensis (ex Durand et al. 2017) TaxID=1720313 RepID=UPI00073F9373|nr:TlyA family RNA methyltransferase [Bittarella massiliensis (ex Durand et al. 2017)]
MKTRLDVYLTEQGLAETRQKAQAYIMAGDVYINGQKADKAGDTVKEGDAVELRGAKLPYVSRGGLKLEKAMAVFPISLKDKICMDVGASTGGFTDCMLQNGAQKVYAVDVGYGQLAWKLRSDERVVNLERQNIRYLTDEQVPDELDFVSVDVSFISLSHVLPVIWRFLAPGGQAVCLIKPQFEAGREKVGKKGVVRDPDTHREVIEKVISLAGENQFAVKGLDFSPVKGPEGNIEYLIFLEKGAGEGLPTVDSERVAETVAASHRTLSV